MFGARILSVLGPILSFGALAWIFKTPEDFYYLLVASLVVIGFSLWRLFSLSQVVKGFKERFVYLVFSLYFHLET